MDLLYLPAAKYKYLAWKQIFQAAWRGFQSKIDIIKSRMHRNAKLITTEASLAEIEEERQSHQALKEGFSNGVRAEAGSWLLADPRFKVWVAPIFCNNPLLWITGKPGAGK